MVGFDVEKVHLRKIVNTETSDEETQTDGESFMLCSPVLANIQNFSELMSLQVKTPGTFYIS